MEHLRIAHRLPIARACAGVGLSRAAWYRPRLDQMARDGPVVAALNDAVARNSRWGFWLCSGSALRGHRWKHKRCWRVYCQMRLHLPRRTKRRLPTVVRQPLQAPSGANQIWALDFMQDALFLWTGVSDSHGH